MDIKNRIKNEYENADPKWKVIRSTEWYAELIDLAEEMSSGEEFTEITFDCEKLGYFIDQLLQESIREKEKLLNAYKDLAEGRSKLLVCYKTGGRTGYESALTKIEKAEKIIAKYSPQEYKQ